MPDVGASGTVLAFDFGMKRIGVAVGETMLGSARALTTLALETNDARFVAIEKLIVEWQPCRLVVGLPFAPDGSEHEMTMRCRRFSNQLLGRFKLPVVLVDERFSSVAADDTLRAQGLDWQSRKRGLDAEAACLILESYFNDPTSICH